METTRYFVKEYETPVSICVEIRMEGVFCGSPLFPYLKPGENEDGIWGDEL